jgi:hypothetical protein
VETGNDQKPGSDAPNNIEDILFARADYEEAKIREIKEAVDRDDRDLVFKLAKELIYGGPGTNKD